MQMQYKRSKLMGIEMVREVKSTNSVIAIHTEPSRRTIPEQNIITQSISVNIAADKEEIHHDKCLAMPSIYALFGPHKFSKLSSFERSIQRDMKAIYGLRDSSSFVARLGRVKKLKTALS